MSRSMGFRVLRTLRALVRKDLTDVRLLLVNDATVDEPRKLAEKNDLEDALVIAAEEGRAA